MSVSRLTDDDRAIVLLCSHLALPRAGNGKASPLTVSEWNALASKVAQLGWRPSALLGRSSMDLREALAIEQGMAERVATLLARGGALAVELERLDSRGIWVLTRADQDYPDKLKRQLGSQAPPVLFGAGEVELLSRDGLAIVGSRDIGEAAAEFAAEVGGRCAEAGLAVFSGGARGVDRRAMAAAAGREGAVVGVLADSLERTVREAEIRRYVLSENLALMTPFHPAAGFSVGNAMARNKLIYSLADAALVVAASVESGGTWAGATENLRAGWVPLLVLTGEGAPPGNRALIERGGIAIEPGSLPEAGEMRSWLRSQMANWEGSAGRARNGVARGRRSSGVGASPLQRSLFDLD